MKMIVGGSENLMMSAFLFTMVSKNKDFSSHFQFLCNVVQIACKINFDKLIRLYNG